MQVKHCCAPLLIIASLGEIVVSKGKMDSYNINCIVCGNNGHDVICICTRCKQKLQCDNYIFVTVGDQLILTINCQKLPPGNS